MYTKNWRRPCRDLNTMRHFSRIYLFIIIWRAATLLYCIMFMNNFEAITTKSWDTRNNENNNNTLVIHGDKSDIAVYKPILYKKVKLIYILYTVDNTYLIIFIRRLLFVWVLFQLFVSDFFKLVRIIMRIVLRDLTANPYY